MGGPAKRTHGIIIYEYDKRPLPEGWQHTQLVDHLCYQGQLIGVKDRGHGMVSLQVGKYNEAVRALGLSLEDAMKKMEAKLTQETYGVA